jgi:hypothetical protein
MSEKNNTDKGPKGLRNIRTFITADALLAAVLLVWAQTWARPSLELWSRYYQPGCGNVPSDLDSFNTSAGSGLVFTYAAVALAILALAWAGWRSLENHKKDTPTAPTALGLFSAALLFGLLNILQSMVSVGAKLIKSEWIYGTYAPLDVPSWCWWVGAVLFVLAVFIPIYAFHKKFDEKNPSAKLWKCLCKIEAVLFMGLAGLWLYSGWGGFDEPYNVIIALVLVALTLAVLFFWVLWRIINGGFKRTFLVSGYLALLTGLGFIFFYGVDSLGKCFMWSGIGLIASVFVVAIVFLICAIKSRSKKKK